MIVWSNLGFLVGLFVFGTALICNLAFDAIWGTGFYSSHHWTVGVALALASVPTWGIGTMLRNRAARTVVDKETGEELTLHGTVHTFFFVPMHVWGVILVVLGFGLAVYDFIG